MKLRKITIRNFRSLAAVEIIPSRTTVLIGENNAGKSNLLHALRLLFDIQAEHLRLDLSQADINYGAKARNEFHFTITVEVGDLQKHQEVETCFRERLSTDGDETYVTIQGRYSRDDSNEYTWSTEVLPAQGRAHDPIKITPRMQRALPLYYLDAVRDAERDTRATGRGLLAQLLTEIDFGDVEAEVQKNLRDANEALNRGSQVSGLATGLTQQLTPPLPGSQTEVVLAVADEDTANLPRNFRLNLRHSPGSAPTDISRYGTGLHNLLLVSMFRHKVTLEKRGTPILAIEEPEAHLHPHAQRRLFKDFQQIDSVIILTTHAPAIAKYADPMSLVLLRCEPNGDTRSFQLKPNITSKERKDLARLMESGRTELFFARALILVEGGSELITFPAFAEVIGCDLDRLGISIISADSNDFAYILKACGHDQFEIPTVVVYDSDALTDDNGLLQEACKAGLLAQVIQDRCSDHTPDVHTRRRAALDALNWIAAEEDHEEEVWRVGYSDVTVQILREGHQEENLNDFLANNGLREDSDGLKAYFEQDKNTKKRKSKIKTLIASRVSEEVRTRYLVPPCYANAIRRAALLSIGDIPVDAHFERRVCDAGYIDIVLTEINNSFQGEKFRQFAEEAQLGIRSAIAIIAYLKTTPEGSRIRPQIKMAVADAVEKAGCPDQATKIRLAELPPVVLEGEG